ncbi:MAG: hypothetical protein V4479_15285, partial [Actinomycetota bacterium]
MNSTVTTSPKIPLRLRLRILQLRALEVQDADTICPEVTDEMIAQFQKQQQLAAQVQDQPPKESISV